MSRYFLLQNTGESSMFGITFSPAALTHLFGLRMKEYRDRVANLSGVPGPLRDLFTAVNECNTPDDRISVSQNFLSRYITTESITHPIEDILKSMRADHGSRSIADVCKDYSISERQLERLFDRYVGLPPKYYARVLRFSHIFKLIQEGSVTWSDVVFLSGYYDQSHFIRDFRMFTGQDPSSFNYGKDSLTHFFTGKSHQLENVGFVQ